MSPLEVLTFVVKGLGYKNALPSCDSHETSVTDREHSAMIGPSPLHFRKILLRLF